MTAPKPPKPRFVAKHGKLYWTSSETSSRLARKQSELENQSAQEWLKIQNAARQKMTAEKFRQWQGKAFMAWQKKTNRTIMRELNKFELQITGKSEWT